MGHDNLMISVALAQFYNHILGFVPGGKLFGIRKKRQIEEVFGGAKVAVAKNLSSSSLCSDPGLCQQTGIAQSTELWISDLYMPGSIVKVVVLLGSV